MTRANLRDPAYLKRRHAQELDWARRATSDQARAVHTQLAERFAEMLGSPG